MRETARLSANFPPVEPWQEYEAASQLCMHSRVISLAGATIFGKGQSWELQKPYIFLNINVSLCVLYPIPLDVVFVIVMRREATPDRIPHVTAGSL